MWLRRILVGAVCIIGVFVIVSSAHAQEQCVIGCAQNDCPQGKERGTQGTNPGFWDINKCESGGCYYCEIDPLIADEHPAAGILRALSEAPTAELRTIVEQHKGRILISPTRGVVAALETGCSGEDFVAAVLFVSPQTTQALEHLGIGDLADFISKSDS